MTVHVKINPEEIKKAERLIMSLDVRKSLDGSLIVSDHPDIDIVIRPNDMKITAYAKKSMDDSIYATQSRLFNFLFNKGVVAQESIRGGNVYSSLEGVILPPEQKMPIDEVALFIVGKFIEEEKPSYMYEKAMEKAEEDRLLEPDEEDSTELGEVPHAEKKGSIDVSRVRRYIQGL